MSVRKGMHYWILIPPTVFANEKLSASEKLIYGKLLGLVDSKGFAFCTNAYLVEQIGISKRQVQRALQNIEAEGLIQIDQSPHGRRIYVMIGGDKNVTGGDTSVTGGVTKMSPINSNTGNQETLELHGNTSNPVEVTRKEKETIKEKESFKDEILEVWEFYKKALIEVANIEEAVVGRMKLNRGRTSRYAHIHARLVEGYTVTDIKKGVLALLRDEWYAGRGLIEIKYAVGNSEKLDRALVKYHQQQKTKTREMQEFRG